MPVTRITTFSASYVTPKLQELSEIALRCPRTNLNLKLTSEVPRTDLYEELNLFRKIVLQELSAVDVVKFIFQTNLSEISLTNVVTILNSLGSSSDCGTSGKIIRDRKLFVILHLPRLTSLSVIVIKTEVAESIGFDDLINISEVRKS